MFYRRFGDSTSGYRQRWNTKITKTPTPDNAGDNDTDEAGLTLSGTDTDGDGLDDAIE